MFNEEKYENVLKAVKEAYFECVISEENTLITKNFLHKKSGVPQRDINGLWVENQYSFCNVFYSGNKRDIVREHVNEIYKVILGRNNTVNRVLYNLFKVFHGFRVAGKVFVYAVPPNDRYALFLERYKCFTTSFLLGHLWFALAKLGIMDTQFHNIFNILVGSSIYQEKIFLLNLPRHKKKPKLLDLYRRTVDGLFSLVNSGRSEKIVRNEIWGDLTGTKWTLVFPENFYGSVSFADLAAFSNPFDGSIEAYKESLTKPK